MKFIYLFIFLLIFDIANCQKHDSVDVKNIEKYLTTNYEKAYSMGLKVHKNNDLDDKFINRLLSLLIAASYQTERIGEAVRFAKEGLDLAEKNSDTVSQINYLTILGNIYQTLYINDKAQYYLNKAEDIIKKNHFPNSQHILKGNIFYLKAMNYAGTLNCEMSIEYFDQAIAAYEEEKKPLSQLNINLAFLNKACCLIEINNLEEAEKYLNLLQINLSEKGIRTNDPKVVSEILNKCIEFAHAQILAKQGEINLSNEILLSILKVEENVIISAIKNDIYLLLSQNFLKIREVERSRYYNFLYQQGLKNRNDIQIKIYNNLLLEEQRISKQKMIDQNTNILKWISILLLFAVSLSPTFLFIYLKTKKINEKLLNDIYLFEK
nr:hypothetical protein [uncultured Chryseobacterium sp.]